LAEGKMKKIGIGKKIVQRLGAAVIELALTLPLLLLLIMGGLSFALQFHVRHCMVGASRAAARELAVRGGEQEAAEAVARNHLNGINANFTFSVEDDGTDVTVRVTVPRSEVSLNIFPAVLSTDGVIAAQTTMHKE
jgi:Flp pilus assembly protein TadG